MARLIKFYTLNIYSLLCANYISIKSLEGGGGGGEGRKRRFMFSDSHLLLTCCPSKSLTKAPKHENFSQIWKFLLETQDYIGSLDNLHKFKESLKIDAWKAFVTWSSYTILCSF